MTSDITTFHKNMLRLRHDYIKRMTSQGAEFRRYNELLAQGFLPARDAQALYRLSHNFVGSGLTFGFPQISDGARKLNRALSDYMDVNVADTENQNNRRDAVYKELQEFEGVFRAIISDNRYFNDVETEEPNVAMRPVIGFFTKKKEDVQNFATAWSAIGYEVLYAHSLKGMDTLAKEKKPFMWIVHSSLTQREIDSLADIQTILHDVPFYISATRDSFATRLAAMRLGAVGLSTVSDDMSQVASSLEARYARSGNMTKRVLIVEDDDLMASLYDHALDDTRYTATRVSNAKEAYETTVRSPHFDLIVMNVDMPGCSGIELAKMFEQMVPPIATPIIFVTAHEYTALQTQDGKKYPFLKKPFQAPELQNIVDQTIGKKQA